MDEAKDDVTSYQGLCQGVWWETTNGVEGVRGGGNMVLTTLSHTPFMN